MMPLRLVWFTCQTSIPSGRGPPWCSSARGGVDREKAISQHVIETPPKGSDGVFGNRPSLSFCSSLIPCLIRRLRKMIETWSFEDIIHGLVVGNGHATTQVVHARSSDDVYRSSDDITGHRGTLYEESTEHIYFALYVNRIDHSS